MGFGAGWHLAFISIARANKAYLPKTALSGGVLMVLYQGGLALCGALSTAARHHLSL